MATIQIRFWREVLLKDQDNNPGRIRIDKGNLRKNNPSPKRSRSETKPKQAEGKAEVSANVSRQGDSNSQPSGEDFTLSPDERQIITFIVSGYSNKDMARHFALSESALYRRIVRIIGKLGVSNKLELVLFAINQGIFAAGQSKYEE